MAAPKSRLWPQFRPDRSWPPVNIWYTQPPQHPEPNVVYSRKHQVQQPVEKSTPQRVLPVLQPKCSKNFPQTLYQKYPTPCQNPDPPVPNQWPNRPNPTPPPPRCTSVCYGCKNYGHYVRNCPSASILMESINPREQHKQNAANQKTIRPQEPPFIELFHLIFLS